MCIINKLVTLNISHINYLSYATTTIILALKIARNYFETYIHTIGNDRELMFD